jgi:predicted acyl esterase
MLFLFLEVIVLKSQISVIKYLLLLFLLLGTRLVAAAKINEDSLYLVQHYNKAEYQIAMRDGVKLFTVVYTPRDDTRKYLILFNRTPYNLAPYGTEMGFSLRPIMTGLAIPGIFPS